MNDIFLKLAALPSKINMLFLNMVMLPSALWQRLGADTRQLHAILEVRLIMDDRKPMGIGQQQKKDRKHGSLLSIIMFLVFGIVYMLPLTVVADRIYSLTFYFSSLLLVMTFVLITDFSNILFDARDKFILFPRPINDRTLVLARMLHVLIYLLRMMIPLSLPGLAMIAYLDGWKSAMLFPLPMILLVFLALFFVNSTYLLVLRLAKPEKFKDIINYFQVITSILFFASVTLLPRLFDADHPRDFNILDNPAIRFLPSYWLAACWSWLGYPVNLHGTAAYSALAIVVPLFCIFILVKWLSPQFAHRIGGIDIVGVAEYTPAHAAKSKPSSGKFYHLLANLLNRTDDAKAGFIITWLQTSRSRSFRMRVLPSFAMVLVYFAVMLMKSNTSFSESLAHMARRPIHLFLLYYSSFVMITAMNYLTMSDQYKASWVYYSSPLAVPGRVMSGALKALWVKYYLPFIIILSGFIIYIWGSQTIVDVILAMVNSTLFICCIARITHRRLPFSIAEQMNQGGGRVLKSVFAMLIPVTLGFCHYFARHFLWLEIIFLVLSSILLWLVWDSYANTGWDNMLKREGEL